MNEEVKRVVDALKLPVWGEAVRVVNDRLSTAALFIENLAAENERLTARCEAAEKDMKKAQACACIICKHHVPSSGRKYRCVIYEDRIDRWGDGEVLMCGRFEWRGQREGETE